MKRLFSKEKIIELIKSIAKIILIMAVVYSTIKDKWVYLVQFYGMPLNQAIELIGNLVIDMGLKISLIFMVIAFADLFYQRHKFKNDIKMTKQEVNVAQKIKEIARENNVEIVENKPLARMLYANVDIGQEVPPELYQSVAEVLAMVYKMQGKI